jgi:hypothetical protein
MRDVRHGNDIVEIQSVQHAPFTFAHRPPRLLCWLIQIQDGISMG